MYLDSKDCNSSQTVYWHFNFVIDQNLTIKIQRRLGSELRATGHLRSDKLISDKPPLISGFCSVDRCPSGGRRTGFSGRHSGQAARISGGTFWFSWRCTCRSRAPSRCSSIATRTAAASRSPRVRASRAASLAP